MNIEFLLIPVDWSSPDLKRKWTKGDSFKLKGGKIYFSTFDKNKVLRAKQSYFLELRILNEIIIIGDNPFSDLMGIVQGYISAFSTLLTDKKYVHSIPILEAGSTLVIQRMDGDVYSCTWGEVSGGLKRFTITRSELISNLKQLKDMLRILEKS